MGISVALPNSYSIVVDCQEEDVKGVHKRQTVRSEHSEAISARCNRCTYNSSSKLNLLKYLEVVSEVFMEKLVITRVRSQLDFRARVLLSLSRRARFLSSLSRLSPHHPSPESSPR